ncbi:WD domain, G-beta repeat [Pirellula sp. SH-Sr6A]|uniref:c-type cytochrome domain-containing protein n=1 Tax=Pirellula sp. SH-Sr6A TaxID=1632865 RepID=UPI00078BF6EA|nr:c-type cytochrome domain-containing protein [Pirellula sp. SH-Sr6A]AMV34921.1 WD domain, G-beta repeat [Pirellula sp. SH-Sr6A]
MLTTVVHRSSFVVVGLWLGTSVPSLSADEPKEISFRRDIAPILQEHCVACHGAKRADGGYRLDTVENLRLPGESEEPPLSRDLNNPGEILARVCSSDPSVRMPSDSEALSAPQTELLKKWIASGAKFDVDDERSPLWMSISPKMAAAPQSYAQPQPITSISLSSDGEKVWLGGYYELLVFPKPEYGLGQRVAHQSQRVTALLPTREGQWIAAGGAPGLSGEIRITEASTHEVVRTKVLGTDLVLDVALHPAGTELACAMTDGTIRILELSSLQSKKVLASHSDWVTQVAYSPDGKQLGSASQDKTAKVFDTTSWETVANYSGHQAALRGIAAAGNGEWQTVGADRQWHRWTTAGAKKTAGLALSGDPGKIAVSDTETIVPCSDEAWHQVDWKGNKITRSVRVPMAIGSVGVDRERGTVVVGGRTGEFGVWSLADGTMLRIVERPFP